MKKKLPSFFDCIALLTITIILLFSGTVLFKIPIPLLLIIAASIAGIKSYLLGHNWSEIEGSIVNGIKGTLRFPAVVILLAGSTIAILVGWLVQGQSILAVLQASYSGYTIHTNNEIINNLLNRGGIVSFLETTLIILCATGLGGIWESGGYITSLHDNLLHKIKTSRMLIISTVLTAVISNIIMAEQYLSIVITGRIYKDAYKRKKLQPFMLSRSLEDGGTVTSPLVPWNSCGAFMSSALGVPTLQYLPYAFFNLVMPVVAIVLTAFGLFIYRKKDE
jgi:NhaC family Na+:H+ antiporter